MYYIQNILLDILIKWVYSIVEPKGIKKGESTMWWVVEWKQWNAEIEDYETQMDSCFRWIDVMTMFNDCVNDEECGGCTVTCMMGDVEYPTNDPIVLVYRP